MGEAGIQVGAAVVDQGVNVSVNVKELQMKVKFIEEEVYPYFSISESGYADIELDVDEEWLRRFKIIKEEAEIMQAYLLDLRSSQA